MAFAASDLNRLVSGADEPLSPEFLYQSAGARIPGWRPGDGLYAAHTMQAIRDPGQPCELDYPYQSHDTAEVTVPVAPPGKQLFSSELSPRHHIVSVVIDLLQAGQPVCLVVRVTDTFFRPANGVVSPFGSIVPNAFHAVLATGWGSERSSGTRYLRIRNSWGPGWGEAGYAWLPEAFADQHVLEAFGR